MLPIPVSGLQGPASSLRMGLLAAVITGAALMAGCVSERETTPPFYRNLGQVGAEVDSAAAASILSHYRSNNGLGAVKTDPALTAIAASQAAALAKAGTVNASLGKDQQLNVRMAGIGEADTHAVENVSAGYRTLAEAFSGWRESPKHNAVMLDKSAARFGIATAYASNAKHKVFWSLIMAGPKGQTAGETAQ